MAFVGNCGVSCARDRAGSKGACRVRARTAVRVQALQALIFDCDGVLADTERDAHRVAFNLAFAENDLATEWSEDRYGKLLEVGGGKERMTAHFNEVGWPAGFPTEEERTELVKMLHKRKTELFGELVQQGRIPLRQGVQALAQSVADKGIPIAVCSTSNEKAVAQIVAMLGSELASGIQIFAGDIVPRKKPSPDIYNLAKEQLGLDPASTVVVEDSYIGLQAAKDAGMQCIVTKSTYTVNEDFTRADRIVDDLESGKVDLATLEELAA